MRFRKGCWLLLAAMLATGCSQGRPTPAGGLVRTRFSPEEAGHFPRGFTSELTGGGGPPAWVVREDQSAGGNRLVLVQESTDQTSYRFPMCIYDALRATDVTVEVRYKALAGVVDQAGGVVLRYRPENYYVARANALEDNIDLFKTVNGNRLKIAEAPVKVAPGQWHSLVFTAHSSHLTVAFDGKVVITAEDTTFTGPGKVGLWTKADSVSAFADLSIEPVR